MKKILKKIKAKYFNIIYSIFFIKDELRRNENIIDIEVEYFDFNRNTRIGIIQIHKNLKSDIENIFSELYNMKFPIFSIIPMDAFGYSDESSVIQNNTSGYNYRYVKGTNRLSDHAKGIAIDINPIQNPWISPNALNSLNRVYDIRKNGTITNEVVEIFKKYNWKWGGDWKSPDYQHFYKNID